MRNNLLQENDWFQCVCIFSYGIRARCKSMKISNHHQPAQRHNSSFVHAFETAPMAGNIECLLENTKWMIVISNCNQCNLIPFNREPGYTMHPYTPNYSKPYSLIFLNHIPQFLTVYRYPIFLKMHIYPHFSKVYP